MTSGLGSTYPNGYPVGRVLSINHKTGEGFSQIWVEPSAKLNSSRLVLLMWPSKTSGSLNKMKPSVMDSRRGSQSEEAKGRD